MSNPESAFWTQIKRNLPPHIIRVENPICPGTPDVNYCVDGIEGWVKLKVIRSTYLFADERLSPNDVKRLFNVSEEQISWAWLRSKARGRVFLLVKNARLKRVAVYRWSKDIAYREVLLCPPYNWTQLKEVFTTPNF